MHTSTFSASDFADSYLGAAPGRDLANVSKTTWAIAEAIGHETLAAPLIATLLWQAFLQGEGLEEFAQLMPFSDQDEVYVVRHPLRGGQPRHDLLVLVRQWPQALQPRGLFVRMSRARIKAGWERLRGELAEAADRGPALRHFVESPEPLLAAADAQEYGIVVAPPPEMIETAAPSPALEVRSPPGAPKFSSAGVIVRRDTDGALGVTAALHAVGGAATTIGQAVTVADRPGIIQSVDVITDSAFVELESVEGIPREVRVRGVMSGLVPRDHETVIFDGRGSGPARTFVTGWTPELPLTSPDTQSRVTTEPDTVPSDSGAALIDSQGYVFGFAFRRTGYNERPALASWIWAESVLRAHDLSIVA